MDELFVKGADADQIDGGAWEDSAGFSGPSGQYLVEQSSGAMRVTDRNSEVGEARSLMSVEWLRFDEAFVENGYLSWIGGVSSVVVAEITML